MSAELIAMLSGAGLFGVGVAFGACLTHRVVSGKNPIPLPTFKTKRHESEDEPYRDPFLDYDLKDKLTP